MGIVAQRQQTTFSNPQNGQSPIDANVVRANDNAIKTVYNGHDADPTIHLQNGLVAARPVASTLGQTWLAGDTGAVYLYYDTGAAWVEANYLRTTGGTMAGLALFNAGITVNAGLTTLQALTVAAITTSALITSTLNSPGVPVLSATAATTGAQYMQLANTGGTTAIGIESSVGGSILSGTAAYATFFGTAAAKALQLLTNNAVQLSIASTGVATFSQQVAIVTGGLSATGNSTITGTLSGLTGLTVASGGATITAGGLTATGNSTIAGTLGGLTGLTMASGLLLAAASTGAGGSGFRVGQGVAPTSPVNGDMWFDGTNFNVRIANTTRTINVT